jgi:hypothetical protein
VIRIVCFSRNRPLQLHGYLASLARCLEQPELVSIHVLVRADPEYRAAYAEVAAEFPDAALIDQRRFADDLLALLGPQGLVCFGCDDVVFVRPFSARALVAAFQDDRLFALSLRLGRNVTRSMFSGPTCAPPMLPALQADGQSLLLWDLHTAHAFGDWGYSFELDGTVYPTEIVRRIVEEVRPASPNLFEAAAGGRWSSKTRRHLMGAWPSARLVVPTVNVVQGDFANPILGRRPLAPRFLLECWQSGLRMDVEAFARQEHDCIHVPDFHLRRAK